MVHVLLRHVRVVPAHFLLESPRCGVVFDADDLGADDPFEPVKHGAGAKPLERSRPRGSVAQADGIVVPVGVAEPQHQTPRRLEPQRFDELLAQQAHGGRAQDDHALLVEADDPLIGAEIQHLGEVDVLPMRRLRSPAASSREPVAHSSDRDVLVDVHRAQSLSTAERLQSTTRER